MYASFFGLNEKPFSITPDPRYLYLSRRHAEALAHLIYGVTESGGFIQLTGEVGTGKTTIVRSLLEQLPAHAEVALVLNPRLSAQEFLLTICDELHVQVDQRDSQKAVIDALNRRLLEAHSEGKRVVLIVDEAQNLSADVLEQVRLLTNLETAKQKLLQIILIGQPELRHVLSRSDLRQLAQRVTGRYHLEPLQPDETRAYIHHRLQVAGGRAEIFSTSAIRALHRSSGGIPRLVNVIADRALLGAWSKEQTSVSPTVVDQAANEVFGDSSDTASRRPPSWTKLALGALTIAVIAVAGTVAWQRYVAGTAADGGRAAGLPPVVERQASEIPAAPVVLDEPAAPVAAPAREARTEPADAGAEAGVAIPATAVLPPLAERLATGDVPTGTDAAFAGLFGLWDADYEAAAGPACQQAESQGLKCLLQRGTWGELTGLNRPAIMVLTDTSGVDHQVVLESMDAAGSARLVAGGETLDVPLAELLPAWFGEYLVLWRPAAGDGRTLAAGARGADVLWLRRTLGDLRGNPVPPPGSDVYEPNLEAAVREFQRLRRLQVDGIAGSMTLLSLNEALGLAGRPRLKEGG
ncbi:MAG: AAA family ATPase [Gammaproteobacteria bacterium]